MGNCLILNYAKPTQLVGYQYDYIRWANESDHHPSVASAFTISETLNSNSSLEIRYANRASWACPFVTTTSGAGFSSNTRSNGTLEVSYWGTTAYSDNTSGTSLLNTCVVKYDKNKLYINGTLKYTGTTPSTNASGLIINQSSYGDSLNSIDIYYIKIWSGSTLVRHLVPCKQLNTNSIGMYDIIKKQFFASAKTTASLSGTAKELRV